MHIVIYTCRLCKSRIGPIGTHRHIPPIQNVYDPGRDLIFSWTSLRYFAGDSRSQCSNVDERYQRCQLWYLGGTWWNKLWCNGSWSSYYILYILYIYIYIYLYIFIYIYIYLYIYLYILIFTYWHIMSRNGIPSAQPTTAQPRPPQVPCSSQLHSPPQRPMARWFGLWVPLAPRLVWCWCPMCRMASPAPCWQLGDGVGNWAMFQWHCPARLGRLWERVERYIYHTHLDEFFHFCYESKLDWYPHTGHYRPISTSSQCQDVAGDTVGFLQFRGDDSHDALHVFEYRCQDAWSRCRAATGDLPGQLLCSWDQFHVRPWQCQVRGWGL